MTNKIEQLRIEVGNIKNALDELKNNVTLPEDEKKSQAIELKTQAENAKQEIESEIHSLESKTDDESKKQKEEAEILLTSFTEITNLYNSIINSSDAPKSTPDTKPAEEKGFFGKAWDWTKEKSGAACNWVGDQREAVRDTGKWERGPEGVKNSLRLAGFGITIVGGVALAGALAYKGVKKAWNRAFSKNREERQVETVTTTKSKKSKKPFWDRWYGRALKWGTIGTSIYWLAHGIFTGNWFNDMLGRGTLKTERAKDQVKKYKEQSPEDIEKYESIGDNINKFYDNIRSKEVSNGYNSPYDLGTISRNVAEDAGNSNADAIYKGLVPFCMDDGLRDIKQLLSERNFTTYLFDKDATEVMTQIKSWTSGAIGNVLGTFVGSLESFIPFSTGSGTFSEKIEAWFKSDPQSRIDELNFFFRQYTKVLTYMKDKERAIAYKITEEKCQDELSGKDEDDRIKFIQNKLSDKDRFQNNVESDSRYQNFMSSKILTSGEALTNAGLFDGEMSPILKKGIIEPLDDEFDNIMQVDEENNTIVDKGIKEINTGTLGNQTKKDLVTMCNNLKDDIEDNNGKGGLFQGFAYTFNTKDSNMQKFLEESGLKDVMNNLSYKIDGLKTKIENGSASEDELKQLKETALAYFAFQKEMKVAIYTFQGIRSTDPDYLRRLLEAQIIGFNNFMARLEKIFNGDGTFGDWLVATVGTGQIILVLSSRARRAAGGAVIDVAKRTATRPIKAALWVAGRPSLSDKGFREALKGLGEASHKESYFLHYLLNGKIRNERFLLDVAKNDLGLRNTDSIGNVLLELLGGTTNPGLTKEDCELLWKYAGNSNIKKLVINESIPDGRIREMLADGFKPGSREFKLNRANFDELKKVEALFNEDYIIDSPKAKKLLERMLSKSVHDVEDLKYIHEMFIDDEFFKVLNEIEDTPKAIRHMAKHLREVKNSTAFSSLTREIESIRTSGRNLPGEIAALEDYRRGLATMDSKEFKITNSFIDLFGTGNFKNDMKIIQNLMQQGIQSSRGGSKYKVKFDDFVDETKINKFIEKLQGSTPEWKKAVFGIDPATGGFNTARFNKFIGSLTDLRDGKKIFSNVADAKKVLEGLVGLAAKLT